ncbi:ABC transporter ATP-binding protein [Brevibacillus laterosporus]|uniref:ABC transporter ATP-binding protein n=1 Tax=Brevibacillus laterosporus TaxID=1465 RepID=UPI002651A68C|nr:ABC transporter ATP-binding protein [Brevibacillus laterosporus]MDN9009283.1 ABC transporter ATP-binding protein [Brevibacillus laterosporus]MDO0940052.1 ABC transporter ATP-binding protein [Brevibacillus laterosporus]
MDRPSKRLWQYALQFKKTLILALTMLSLAVVADLMGPILVKQMIDVHIRGIEYSWYQSEQGSEAVAYRGQYIKRSDHWGPDEQKGKEVRILQVGREYYFIDQPIAFDGEKTIENGVLLIQKGADKAVYPAEKLTSTEVFALYKPEVQPLIALCLIYFGLLAVISLLLYVKKYWLQISANQIIQKMRVDVFDHIQRLPIRYFDNLPAGKVVARVTNDTEAIRDLYLTVLSNFFTGIIYITGILVAMFLLDPMLGAICLVIIPILLVWIYVYRYFASRFNHVIRARISDINGMINESIQGMAIIQAFRRQKETKEEFEELNYDHFKYQNKLLLLNSLTSHNLTNFLRIIGFALLLWYFGAQSLTLGNALSLGMMYAFLEYIVRLFNPISGIVNQLPQLEQALVAAERVFELMNEPGIPVTDGKMDRYRGNVKFENVWFAYKDEEYVLKNISFEAKEGQTIALVGHTGSGKSSIMNILFRFYDFDKGKVTIDGKEIQEWPKQYVRQHMGIVLQEPFLFTGTIASNVSLGDPSISRERVEKALDDVGARQLFAHLSKGYDEPVVEKGSTLSAGQRQIVSFARALAFDPAILILDEATASIDTETESIIQKALDVVKRGRTTFIIAHRLSTIRQADCILVLDRGEIVERGNHDELMQIKGKYYQMYQLQQGETQKIGV